MLHTKEDLCNLIKSEISERKLDDRTEEVEALTALLTHVEFEKPLEFGDYQWLADLAATAAELRAE